MLSPLTTFKKVVAASTPLVSGLRNPFRPATKLWSWVTPLLYTLAREVITNSISVIVQRKGNLNSNIVKNKGVTT